MLLSIVPGAPRKTSDLFPVRLDVEMSISFSVPFVLWQPPRHHQPLRAIVHGVSPGSSEGTTRRALSFTRIRSDSYLMRRSKDQGV